MPRSRNPKRTYNQAEDCYLTRQIFYDLHTHNTGGRALKVYQSVRIPRHHLAAERRARSVRIGTERTPTTRTGRTLSPESYKLHPPKYSSRSHSPHTDSGALQLAFSHNANIPILVRIPRSRCPAILRRIQAT